MVSTAFLQSSTLGWHNVLFWGNCFLSVFNSWRPFWFFSALCDLFAHPTFYIKCGVSVPEKCYILKHFHLVSWNHFWFGADSILCLCQKPNMKQTRNSSSLFEKLLRMWISLVESHLLMSPSSCVCWL